MITQFNLQLVNDLVSEWTVQGKMFTAYDVSREAQRRGGDQRHLTMRESVHETILAISVPAGYIQTIVTIPGVAINPILYHPIGNDPNQYLTQGQKSLPAPIAAQYDVNDGPSDVPLLDCSDDCGHDHDRSKTTDATTDAKTDVAATGIAALWKRFWK